MHWLWCFNGCNWTGYACFSLFIDWAARVGRTIAIFSISWPSYLVFLGFEAPAIYLGSSSLLWNNRQFISTLPWVVFWFYSIVEPVLWGYWERTFIRSILPSSFTRRCRLNQLFLRLFSYFRHFRSSGGPRSLFCLSCRFQHWNYRTLLLFNEFMGRRVYTHELIRPCMCIDFGVSIGSLGRVLGLCPRLCSYGFSLDSRSINRQLISISWPSYLVIFVSRPQRSGQFVYRSDTLPYFLGTLPRDF